MKNYIIIINLYIFITKQFLSADLGSFFNIILISASLHSFRKIIIIVAVQCSTVGGFLILSVNNEYVTTVKIDMEY